MKETKMKKPLITIEGRKIEEWFAAADWAIGTPSFTYVHQHIEEAINISLEKAQEIIEEYFEKEQKPLLSKRHTRTEKEKENKLQAVDISEVSLEDLLDYCNRKKEQDTIKDQQVNREYVDKIAYSSQFKETIDDKYGRAAKEYEIKKAANYKFQEWLYELKELIEVKYRLNFIQLKTSSHYIPTIIFVSGGVKKEAEPYPHNSFFDKPMQAWNAYYEKLEQYLKDWPQHDKDFMWLIQPKLIYNEELDLWTIYSRFFNPWTINSWASFSSL